MGVGGGARPVPPYRTLPANADCAEFGFPLYTVFHSVIYNSVGRINISETVFQLRNLILFVFSDPNLGILSRKAVIL